MRDCFREEGRISRAHHAAPTDDELAGAEAVALAGHAVLQAAILVDLDARGRLTSTIVSHRRRVALARSDGVTRAVVLHDHVKKTSTSVTPKYLFGWVGTLS